MYKSSPVVYSYVELTVPSFSLSLNDGVALEEVEIRAEEALEADLRHLESQPAALQASGVEAAGELDLFEMSR